MNSFAQLFIRLHTKIYRATGGKLGGKLGPGKVLLLTTIGNKSGQERTVPLVYFEFDGNMHIVASAAGAPGHPAWYKNLQARPEVTVEVGKRRLNAKAVTVDDAQRDALYEKIKQQMPQFAGYEKKTTRKIPLVRLEPLP
jgi:deazaflavin-dependent oxidoreductase (nitroreductase family)